MNMTPAQYRDIIAHLGLSQEASGVWLGYSPRQGQRFANGEAEIPKAVVMLLRTMMKHHLKIDKVERGA